MRTVFAGISLLTTLALMCSAPAQAATPNLGKCLDLSGRTSLRLSSADDDLGLTREQILEAKDRVSQFWRGRSTTWTLDGLGFTPEQEATFTQRVQAQIARSSWPIGSPCAPFKNRSKVVQRIRELLVFNGFRPAMRFYNPSPRQITLRAIQDGVEMLGVVVKTGPRKVFVSIRPLTGGGGGGSLTVPLAFEP